MAIVYIVSSIPLSIIDIRERRIPDRILLPVAAFIAMIDAVDAGIDLPSLAAAAIAALAMVCAGRASKSGMGMGDVKMGSVGTFALGPAGGWIMLASAAVLGIVYGLLFVRNSKSRKYIPFAPFISIGAVCALCVRALVF